MNPAQYGWPLGQDPRFPGSYEAGIRRGVENERDPAKHPIYQLSWTTAESNDWKHRHRHRKRQNLNGPVCSLGWLGRGNEVVGGPTTQTPSQLSPPLPFPFERRWREALRQWD